MPKLSNQSVLVLNGKIVLFRRSRSPLWQARFRIGRKWIRTSTKTEDVKEAENVATDFYMEAKFKEKHNMPVTSRKFKSVAEAVKNKLQEARDSGQGKAVYKDYIQAIDGYLIPFFGNHNVETIDYPLLQKFSKWREQKLKREPARSTINTHTAALNRTFDEAVSQSYMQQSQVPQVKVESGHGKKTQRRPDFSIDEYRELYRFMRSWVKQGKAGKPTEMRMLLRDTVLLLGNSGIRPWTEVYNLKWRHIELRDNCLVLHVKGKTEPHEVIPRGVAKRYLRRIQLRAHDLKVMAFEEALKQDKYVFRLADGTRSKNLHQTFRTLMADSELGICPRTDKMRTAYSLRHFYITQALQNNRASLHTIAKNCGTSVGMLEKHYSHLEVWAMREDLMR